MSEIPISASIAPNTAAPTALPAHLERNLAEHERRAAVEWKGRVHPLHGVPAPADAVVLCNNDYLRLANHPSIVEAKVAALRSRTNDVLMSAAFLEEDAVQHDFERAMAEHLRCEAAILCQSGYAANVGLMQTLTSPEIPVYVDRLAHMSLWDGVLQVRAPVRPFRHNDLEDLEAKIGEGGPGIVVVDSVYSSDGSVCPLRELVSLARGRGCTLVVDESHALGTHGARGEGLVCQLGLEADVAFRTASLSKAFCGIGGVVACPERFVEWFRMHSHPAIFSSAVLPYQAVGFLETLRLVRTEGWRRAALHEMADRLRAGLDGLGYCVDASRAQIIALEAGSEYRTVFLRDLLAARGVVGAPFIAPATGLDRGFVRLTAHCELTRDHVERVLEVCAEVREAVELSSWRSTRRKRASQSGTLRPGPRFTHADERKERRAVGRAS